MVKRDSKSIYYSSAEQALVTKYSYHGWHRTEPDNFERAEVDRRTNHATMGKLPVGLSVGNGERSVGETGGKHEITGKAGIDKSIRFVLPPSYLQPDSEKRVVVANYLVAVSHLPKVR
jgi:hypothetical protein